MMKKKQKTIYISLDALRLCVRKSFFIFAFVILFSLGALAQSSNGQTIEPRTPPADFKNDGCSLFPDCDYGDCCAEHDNAYYFGGTSKERWQADKKLYKCVRAKKGFHHKIIAPIMWLGVRIGGAAWIPTPYRWGFGKTKAKKPKTKNNSPTANAKKNKK